ncbi:DEAD-domain-containing protein [Hortaea werneckii]|nr:DEAD-domain-containing protein [Hortaea werneckii]
MKRKLNQNDVPEAIADGSSKKSKTTPPPTFADLHLDPRLIQAIQQEKFATPTPVQAKGIPLSLAGQDILGRAKTGSGKTLAYLLPVLHHLLQRKASQGKKSRHTSALILVPTKELATQVANTLKTFTSFCAQEVRFENISRKEDAAVTKARLAENPDIVIATPGQASKWLNQTVLSIDNLKNLIIDEADLVLNYGYEEDLQTLSAALPTGVQKIMMSATLRTEIDALTALFFPDASKPTILDLSAEEAAEKPTLAQYTVRTAEADKFLLIYTIFKLQLIKGKVIIFVADIDRCYRVKLFLEQFGIRSCVLNSELPVNSRLHAVEEFNKGVYDIIVAADENEVVGNEGGKSKRQKQKEKQKKKEEAKAEEQEANEDADGGAESREDQGEGEKKKAQDKKQGRKGDREFGVSRGIDFRHVACVLNFDLPTTPKSYLHRIGRTARAGQTGMALSFYVPKQEYRKHKPTSIEQCEHDEEVLDAIKKEQQQFSSSDPNNSQPNPSVPKVQEWAFDMSKLEGFRYRFTDALRAVTRIAVREARTKELRQELINSSKLKQHFEENPDDLRHLRHDQESHAVRQQPHLRHVPEYLLPAGGKAAVARDVGYVGLRKEGENSLRKRRGFNKTRGKGRIVRGKGLDPLRSLNARGRGKK